VSGAYYNENDPYAAEWLRRLCAEGLIAPGKVDARDIRDVAPSDLSGFAQAHFFAGIGGWSLALRQAGWVDERPVWTGSCPCQPLSCAGQRKGHADKRHLWPAFQHLISKCRPAIVFGEQVAGKDGREWLSGVRADLEALGYALGAADLCAASVGAPHIRQRLYWLAHTKSGWKWNGGGREEIQSSVRAGSGVGFWDRFDKIQGSGTRRIEPETSPLAPRFPGYVGPLRAYGNSIVPQVAAEFIKASMT
jgi:DNA (cytosine-5)-methyltransferase 1